MAFRLRRRKRDGQRGAAAVEFALSMFVLVPILIGICEYAYFFYIGINAVEAERAGLLVASKVAGLGTCSSAAQTALGTSITTEENAYFHLNSLDSVVTIVSSTVGCSLGPPAPILTLNLTVDYRPLFGFTMPWEKQSPTAGYLRYTVGTLSMRGTP